MLSFSFRTLAWKGYRGRGWSCGKV
jgi:hypothetical protein